MCLTGSAQTETLAQQDWPPSWARVSLPRPEYYRQKAEECRRQAERASAPGAKEQWMSLVAQWERLAKEVEGRQDSQFAGQASIAAAPKDDG
jgi:anaerobic glycerol-3-phosphate dehydrogenase